MSVTRRTALAGGAAALGTAFFGPWKHVRVYAQASDRPLRIGLSVDLDGTFRDDGIAERRGIQMAIKEFNARGGVLGRKIEVVTMNTRSNPDLAPSVARDLIERENVGFMLGGIHSGVARRLSEVAQKHGVIYMNTNSSAPSESGDNCHRTKFVWDASGKIFGQAVVKHAMRWLGPNWFLFASDYSWGRETAAAVRKLVEDNGGRIIGEKFVPLGFEDFGRAVAEITAEKPNVVYTVISASDLEKLRMQIKDTDLIGRQPAWIASQQDWPAIWGTRAQTTFGIFSTTWYHKLDLPGVQDFVARFQESFPNGGVPVPGNVFHNAYMATRELLRVVEESGTTNNIAIIKKLEGRQMSALDRMQHFDAWIDPKGHRVQQTVYLATRNPNPSDETDLYSIIGRKAPAEVVDKVAPANCRLEPFDSIPSFDA